MIIIKQNKPRTHLSATGSFVSVPFAFKGADEGLRNVVKMEFKTIFSKLKKIETVFSTDWILLDIGAVIPSALNPKKIARDCEVVRQIALDHPELLRRLVEAFQPGAPNNPSDLDKTYNIVKKMGLTEEELSSTGGGLVGLLIVLALVALSTGCAHCNKNVPDAKPAPKPPAE